MKLATKEQSKEILAEAGAWLSSAPANHMWSTAKGCARTAVAEFIANTKYEVTLYESASET